MSWKPPEEDDPMEVVGVLLPEGDLDETAAVIVEEFVRAGYDDETLMELFRNPFYQATHWIYRARGEAYVRGLIERTRRQWSHPGVEGGHAEGV